MNIRVIIDKLGPIQNSEIEFKPFLVYTGESGLGKSYTALLWYNLLTYTWDIYWVILILIVRSIMCSKGLMMRWGFY